MNVMELRDIYRASGRISGHARETPLDGSPFLGDLSGGEVRLKLENQQLTGSFKVRGALNKMLKLSPRERARGVVTASAGNHAQGIGYAARILGVESTIVVPSNTPMIKREAIQRYGVTLIVHGDEYMEAETYARELERDRGLVFASAYNDIDIVAGQGTVGLEVAYAWPEIDVALVPVGGGGLISGVGCALKGVNEGVEVVGVQSVASPVMYESMRRGHIVEMELDDSVAEGLHGGIEEGSVTFDLCRRYVDEIILVQEETILEAMGRLLKHQHQVVEGAGAVGAAAIMEDPGRFRGRRVGVVVSGGNVEADLLREALSKV
ncbi:pyridoxal-phosphate dependent enzyme [Candidatus Bathyarchaeota archaeon]|nr:pyridoxal-phosphate dependent enzyme [Candidatus Bathyarchaeota archaeon]